MSTSTVRDLFVHLFRAVLFGLSLQVFFRHHYLFDTHVVHAKLYDWEIKCQRFLTLIIYSEKRNAAVDNFFPRFSIFIYL